MRSIRIIPWMLSLAFLAPFTGAAQEKLSLQQALNYAIQNNTTLNKAKLDIENGRYRTQEVKAGALPQIDATASLTDQLLKQRLVFGGQNIQVGTTWNTSAQVNLNQKLFDQSVFTGLKAAKASESYYNLNAQLTEENLVEQVATSYYQVLVTRQQINVIESNINRVQQLEKSVADQYKNGLAKKIDLDRVRVNLTNLYNDRDQLTNTVTQQENNLKYYMGMPINTSINIPQAELTAVETGAVRMRDSLDVAVRTEFQLIKKQEDLLLLQKKAYQAEYYPSLSFTSNYSYNGLSDKFFLRSNTGASWYDMSSIGLSLRIPIFDGKARSSRVKQANVQLLKNKQDQKDLQQSLNLTYENARIQINNSLNTIRLQQENVRLAQEVYTSSQNNYRNGLASLTDLLNSETDLVAAQNNYSQALLNYKLAEIQLIKSNGNIKSLLTTK